MNPFNFVLIALVIGAGLAALTVLGNTLLPDFVRRGRDNATQHFWRAFLIGFVNLLFFGVITLALTRAQIGLLKVVGVIVATVLLAFLVVGASIVARIVGEKLRPNDASVTKQVLAGIVTIELAELFPLVGWIVVPLVAASTGLGAVILTLFQRRTAALL
jgi:hypothetical protein